MSETFKPGDVVELKSGSHPLTVISGSDVDLSVMYYDFAKSQFLYESVPMIAVKKHDPSKTKTGIVTGRNPSSPNTY
ncbi:hypothetical protein ACTJJB_30865 [Chitinophaga sp. 22536]|uniref:hypothetical protein n=1 Tax=unclassified Chitinophaga TaxID=2619133 RepID=UPI003F86AC9A